MAREVLRRAWPGAAGVVGLCLAQVVVTATYGGSDGLVTVWTSPGRLLGLLAFAVVLAVRAVPERPAVAGRRVLQDDGSRVVAGLAWTAVLATAAYHLPPMLLPVGAETASDWLLWSWTTGMPWTCFVLGLGAAALGRHAGRRTRADATVGPVRAG